MEDQKAFYSREWERIVKQSEELIGKTEIHDVQPAWEKILEDAVFGYSKGGRTLDAQCTVRMGRNSKRADIALKNREGAVQCLIELKKEVKTKPNDIGQLLSYLKQMNGKVKVGVFICDRIYVYEFVLGREDAEQKRIEIEFDEKDPLGPRFVELLSIDKFNANKICGWINETLESKEKMEAIRDSLKPETIKEAVVAWLRKDYGDEEIDEALQGYVFNVQKPVSKTQSGGEKPPVAPSVTPPTNGNAYRLAVTKSGVEATMAVRDGKYVVLAGSRYATKVAPSFLRHNYYYYGLRQDLERRGVMRDGVFAQDAPFPSPSAAAAVTMGRAANGRKCWEPIGGAEPRLP